MLQVGGLTEQIRQMREVIELPLTNPELFLVLLCPCTVKRHGSRKLPRDCGGSDCECCSHVLDDSQMLLGCEGFPNGSQLLHSKATTFAWDSMLVSTNKRQGEANIRPSSFTISKSK